MGILLCDENRTRKILYKISKKVSKWVSKISLNVSFLYGNIALSREKGKI